MSGTAGRRGDVTPTQAWELLTGDERTVLVDVRTRAEWAFVGVPDLSGLPSGDREAALVEWTTYPDGAPNPAFLQQVQAAAPDRDATVLFLCRSGVRSQGAADAATAAGYTSAYNVLEGFEGGLVDGHRGGSGWRAAGLPWRQS